MPSVGGDGTSIGYSSTTSDGATHYISRSVGEVLSTTVGVLCVNHLTATANSVWSLFACN